MFGDVLPPEHAVPESGVPLYKASEECETGRAECSCCCSSCTSSVLRFPSAMEARTACSIGRLASVVTERGENPRNPTVHTVIAKRPARDVDGVTGGQALHSDVLTCAIRMFEENFCQAVELTIARDWESNGLVTSGSLLSIIKIVSIASYHTSA